MALGGGVVLFWYGFIPSGLFTGSTFESINILKITAFEETVYSEDTALLGYFSLGKFDPDPLGQT